MDRCSAPVARATSTVKQYLFRARGSLAAVLGETDVRPAVVAGGVPNVLR
jgi:hypothetical protein